MHGTTDGALLCSPRSRTRSSRACCDQGYRFVVVDPRMPLDEGIPAVSAAQRLGRARRPEHLLSLGHRRIGAITGPGAGSRPRSACSGYHAALASAGIMPDPALELASDFADRGRRRGRRAAARRCRPPTAIFAFNDNMAIGAMQAARARGLRVPEDLSIVGFDDIELAAIVTPALTTVRQPLAEMGRMAVSLLTRLLDGQRFEALHVELATRFIVRDSTARDLALGRRG